MKKLLVLLFSIFLLSSPSVFADDISDFQIEGISIGDSLLDYMTEDEILEWIEITKDNYYFLKEPYKYSEVHLSNFSSTYEAGLSFFIKDNSTNKYINNKNEKYTILSIRGMKNYIEDFDSCIQKRDEIAADLSHVFPYAQKSEDFFKHNADPSGNSIVDGVYFRFDTGGEGEVSCLNFEETFRTKVNWSEGLDVAIDSAEIVSWLGNH